MKKIRKKKMMLDIAILLILCIWVIAANLLDIPEYIVDISFVAVVIIGIIVFIDLIWQYSKKSERKSHSIESRGQFPAYVLILLDDQEKPIKSWTLTGKTSLIIGRKNKDEEVDVDLSECEYSGFINIQHAVLNYCLDSWYLEDLDSQNGVKIKKVEDSTCYRVTQSRPCRIKPGDVIYIANTRLLFT